MKYLFLFIKSRYQDVDASTDVSYVYSIVIIAVLILFNVFTIEFAITNLSVTANFVSSDLTLLLYALIVGLLFVHFILIKRLHLADAKVYLQKAPKRNKILAIVFILFSILGMLAIVIIPMLRGINA